MSTSDLLDRAFVAQIPVLIKARPTEAGGRRIVEVQCSSETVDMDGDIVLQDALLKAASGFVNKGHLDIDHLSEFGYRLGIPDPSSYIVGRPLDVRSGPNHTTFVEGEISKSIDGTVDVVRNRFDEFWMSLQREPPVTWFSSIYGWPTDMDDFSNSTVKNTLGVTRLLIKAIEWNSLAFTRSPKNTGLTNPTRIVTAKAYLAELAKSVYPAMGDSVPNSMTEVWKAAHCPTCKVESVPSLIGYRRHFITCKGCPSGMADVFAHAMMHKTRMDRALPLGR